MKSPGGPVSHLQKGDLPIMTRTNHHSKSGEGTSEPSESKASKSTASKSGTSTASESTTSTSRSAATTAKSLIATLTAMAGAPLALTAKERRRAVRLRKGGEKVIPTITALSEQYGLTVPSHPTSAITANVNKANSLVAVHKQLVTATKQVEDAIFKAQSESWDGATVHYTVLKRLAKSDGDIATALAPVKEFFAQKSPAVVKAEDAKRGGRKGTKAKSASATPATATTEPASAQTPAASATPAPAPAAVQNGATHS
jgi:hypothetical protein